ncbi:MAG: thiamine-phosphate kinase [Nitrososphaeria archaeon]|nr:thiamine-phosphate kinase [Nitrosopumilaceae archaeon]NIP09759.1 thiamine-phosphate kinase [Nitrosopumilaceae archaeon]NIP91306.1 thiamine-phosphate kinase [Nitrososphaeria archaeon]NIS95818.1 thiamine-phosphate kinase [Nitrosopumilaceae archaeon]
MTKLNERKIIQIFQNNMGNKRFVSEDVEFFKVGKTNFVLKVDTLVQSTDIPNQMSLQDAARKSVVACVSDFASKGVKPEFGLVSITIPKKLSDKKIKDIASGLGKASKEFGFKFLGGDTNEGKEIVIHVLLFGSTKKIILRKGAKTNDKIITTGPFGYSSAGLKILLEKKKASGKFSKKAKKSVFRPNPKLKFGVENAKFFSSSMDSSDGLATTLHEMVKQSKRQFTISKLPTNRDVLDFAKTNKIKPFDLVFHGGEEYEIVATISPKNLSKVKSNAKRQKISLFEIGKVSAGAGVVYKTGSKTIKIKNKGWLHFRS